MNIIPNINSLNLRLVITLAEGSSLKLSLFTSDGFREEKCDILSTCSGNKQCQIPIDHDTFFQFATSGTSMQSIRLSIQHMTNVCEPRKYMCKLHDAVISVDHNKLHCFIGNNLVRKECMDGHMDRTHQNRSVSPYYVLLKFCGIKAFLIADFIVLKLPSFLLIGLESITYLHITIQSPEVITIIIYVNSYSSRKAYSYENLIGSNSVYIDIEPRKHSMLY